MEGRLSSVVGRRTVILCGVVYLIGEGLHLLSVDPRILWALGAPFSVVFGIPGIIAFAVGQSVPDLVASGFHPTVLIRFVGTVLALGAMFRLWGGRPLPKTGDSVGRLCRTLTEFALCALVAVSFGVAVTAFGNSVVGYRTFAVASLVTFRNVLVPFALLGPVVLVGLSAMGHDASDNSGRPVSPRRAVAVGGATAGWLIVGGSLSVVHRDIVSIPGITRQTLREFLPAVLEPLGRFVLGPEYYPVQGAVAVSAVVITASLLVWPPRSVSST